MGKRTAGGSYGRVFHAVHEDRPEAGGYALKVAVKPSDERFEREAHLLSRIRHPSVPRLEARGTWTSPQGEDYPYLVMEWVEGLSPYSWALEYGLTVRQAIGQLAQVARALQATHLHGVHRDVKGGNIRVSAEGKAVLLDFGSCWYPEASPLTGIQMPPGTDNYRSPQQLLYEFALKCGWREGPYQNTAADDLYALGVTAYRLLAGAYPPPLPENEDGSQKPVRQKAPRGLEQVCPELSELIERLLAEDPQERGSAQQIAEELEALLEYARLALDEPWVANATRQPTAKAEPPTPQEPAPLPGPRKPAPQSTPRKHSWKELVLGSAVAGGCLLLALPCVLLTRNLSRRYAAAMERERNSQKAEQPDAGTAVGEEGLASVSRAESPPLTQEDITREMSDKPLPGQKRPPCNYQAAVVINGGCWRLQASEAKNARCEADDEYEFAGRCYLPLMTNAVRVPTSDEP